MKKLIAFGCLSYFIIGSVQVAAGSVMEPMTAHYGRDYADGGQFVFNQFAGFLVGVLALPRLLERLGERRALTLAYAVLTAAELAFALRPPWGWMLAAAPLAGVGVGMIEAIVGAMIIEHVRERKAETMNRLEVFFGLGALLIPIVSGLFIRILLWNGAFIAIAAAALTALLLWRTRAFGELVARLEGNRRRRTTAGRTPPAAYSGKERLLLAMMMVFFFIYVGVEISVANFLPSMQVDRLSVAPDTAAFSITALWATITFGRLFAGAVAERIGYAAFLMLGCLGTCAALTALVFADRLWSNYAAVLLFGLMLAGLFAIALVFANQAMPGKTSRTTSILIASGGIGGAVLPRLTGWLMDTAGTASTQWALAGLGAAMVLVVAAAMMYAKRRLPRPADPAAHPQQ